MTTEMFPDKKKLMKPSEVQELFRISRPTEHRWRKKGFLPAPSKIGGQVYYEREKIYLLLAAAVVDYNTAKK